MTPGSWSISDYIIVYLLDDGIDTKDKKKYNN